MIQFKNNFKKGKKKFAYIFKCVQIITDMMAVKEQKISIDTAQLIKNYNSYKQGRDLLTELKQLAED